MRSLLIPEFGFGREIDELFSSLFSMPAHDNWLPSMESYTKDGKLELRVDLPGVDPKDVEISLEATQLVIRGERKSEREEKNGYREVRYPKQDRVMQEIEKLKLHPKLFIWGERDWKRWAKVEVPSLQNVAAFNAMSPDEFLSWIENEYVSKAPSGPEDWRGKTAQLYLDEVRKKVSEVDEKELEIWKRWVLWEIERILVTPIPPAPEMPRYGIVEGKALPLPKALELTKGQLEKCEQTGTEIIMVHGPGGQVLASYPVVRATSSEQALRMMREP